MTKTPTRIDRTAHIVSGLSHGQHIDARYDGDRCELRLYGLNPDHPDHYHTINGSPLFLNALRTATEWLITYDTFRKF